MEFFISFFCPRLPSIQAKADPANADNSIKCTAFRLGVVSCGEERGHLIQLGSGLIQRWEQRSLCCGVLPGAWCRISMRGFLGSCTGIYPLCRSSTNVFSAQGHSFLRFMHVLLLPVPHACSGTGDPCCELSCPSDLRCYCAVFYQQGFLL